MRDGEREGLSLDVASVGEISSEDSSEVPPGLSSELSSEGSQEISHAAAPPLPRERTRAIERGDRASKSHGCGCSQGDVSIDRFRDEPPIHSRDPKGGDLEGDAEHFVSPHDGAGMVTDPKISGEAEVVRGKGNVVQESYRLRSLKEGNDLRKESEGQENGGFGNGVTGCKKCGGEKEAAAAAVVMRVVEVTDLFRTTKGFKCTLTEAYACCFDRAGEVRGTEP